MAVGFLSGTLLYQFSRTGLRIYSINRFSQGPYQLSKEKEMKYAEIYHEDLALENVPQVGNLVGEILQNAQPPLPELRYFNQKMSVTVGRCATNWENNYLVYIYEDHMIDSIKFLSYKSYVSRIIDSEGNWRLGLNILKRVYEGIIFELDGITFKPSDTKGESNKELEEFKRVCEDYVIRFVEKTKSIIKLERGENQWSTEDIQNQESLFLCDFLIRTDNTEFLMDEIALKMENAEIHFLDNLRAFILLKRVHTIGHHNISFYFNSLDPETLSKLVYSLDTEKSELNQIKSNAIRKKLYLEFIYLCTEEKDFYTPFVILMAMFQEERDPHLILLLLYFLKKCIAG